MALHQAIKFDKSGKQLLALGQAGKSGSGPKAFCKPTQVAVGRDGSIYVSGAHLRCRAEQAVACSAGNGIDAAQTTASLSRPGTRCCRCMQAPLWGSFDQ